MQSTPNHFQNILSKFLLNLPREELDDPCRLSYHAEKALYYYLDHVVQEDKDSDWKKKRREFFTQLKLYTPSFLKINPSLLSDKLLENKPVCGAIIFNRENSKVLVIRVGERYGFPKGKQNQGETLEGCAIREVEEETGIDISAKIEPRIRVDFVNHEGKIFFFVARGVSEEERISIDLKEIDEVIWMNIDLLKKEINCNFVERSKIAWSLFERDYAGKSSCEQYAPKYYKRDSEEFTFEADPLLQFKLDRQKLSDIMLQEGHPKRF